MNKSTITKLSVRITVLLLLGGGLYLGHTYVLSLRAERDKATAELEAKPGRLLEAARQQSDLARRQHDIDRIEALLVPRSDVVSIVSRIEEEARQVGVTAAVPEIEEVKVDESGGDSVAGMPVVDVRLQITATGSPEQMIAFAHKVEHLPYLLYLETWTFKNEPPIVINKPEGEEGPPPAQSNMNVIVTVTSSDG